MKYKESLLLDKDMPHKVTNMVVKLISSLEIQKTKKSSRKHDSSSSVDMVVLMGLSFH